jgi:hypothetical protein
LFWNDGLDFLKKFKELNDVKFLKEKSTRDAYTGYFQNLAEEQEGRDLTEKEREYLKEIWNLYAYLSITHELHKYERIFP